MPIKVELKVELYEMNIIFTNKNDSVERWKWIVIRRRELHISSSLLRAHAPYTVSYCSFLNDRAKIFGYISAQRNIYIHSVRGRHLRTTGKFGGVAVFKVRTMWTAGILNLNKIWFAPTYHICRCEVSCSWNRCLQSTLAFDWCWHVPNTCPSRVQMSPSQITQAPSTKVS